MSKAVTHSDTAPGFFRKRMDQWLFRIGAPDQGEIHLTQRRVFIVPTRPGLGFGLLLVVLFIGSVNYDLSLGFALTFLIAACAVVDMHLTFRNLAHLYLKPGRATPVFAGEEAQFELHLSNRSGHDRYAIWLGFIGNQAAKVEQPVDIAAGSTRSVMLGARALQRGWMNAPRIRLQTRFPLGLLRAWSYWQPDMRVLVYPQPEQEAQALPIAAGEQHDGKGSAGHDDFAGIRAYQSGDSMRHLAWRQIARMQSQQDAPLIAKYFEGGAALELAFDFDELPNDMDLEARLSRMTRWVLEAEARGLPYAFSLGQTRLQAALGPAHQISCLQALALHQAAP